MVHQANGHVIAEGAEEHRETDTQRLVDKKKHKSYGCEDGKQDAEEEKEKPSVSFLQLFRFADRYDRMMILLGCLCACVTGSAWPYTMVLLSDTIEKFVDFARYDNFLDEVPHLLVMVGLTKDDARKHIEKLLPYCPLVNSLYTGSSELPNCSEITSADNVFDEMEDTSLRFFAGGLIVMFCAFGQLYLFVVSSERQMITMRAALYRNILRQEASWFDGTSTGELGVKLTEDIRKIHDVIGDKCATSLQWLSSSVSGFIICYSYGWELALMLQIAGPLLFLSFGYVGMVITKMARMEMESYAKAGGVAEEVISSMRTVQAFNGQEKEALRYAKSLERARDLGVRKSMIVGVGLGISWFILFSNWALGFYYGGWLVRHSDYSVKDMMTVFFTALIGCLSLGLAVSSLVNVKTGRAAAYGVYAILDRKSKIDGLSCAGVCPSALKGSVSFRDVHFRYPSRPEVEVLNGLDLFVPAGKTTALVGSSGGGKSTVLQLILRFYDPDNGQVCLDDVDVRGIQPRYLRQCVGLVSQEPVLFSATIEENVRYGREGVTRQEIEQACREANAYDFIMRLPDQFQTQVGERGAQLSGGQKQRIAIARALVRNPQVLLLDEATSALDTESETVVQEALDKASKGRTTIVVAHRLTTVRNADQIVVLDKGKVAEKGTHEELMTRESVYFNLVKSQLANSDFTSSGDLGGDSTTHTDRLDNNNERLKANSVNGIEGTIPSKNVATVSPFDTRDPVAKGEEDDDEAYTSDQLPSLRLLGMLRGQWHFLLVGCLACLLNGALQPAWSLIMAEVIQAYTKNDMGEQSKKMSEMSLFSVGVAVLSFVAYFLQEYMFGLAGEAVTLRMRDMLFRAILRQDISWFDDRRHETGILTYRLAVEASSVHEVVRTTFGTSVLCFGNLGTGLIISFICGWQLALALLGLIPFVVLAGVLTTAILGGAYNKGKGVMEDACKGALASIDNQRTVASLTLEERLCHVFRAKLAGPFRENLSKSCYACMLYGVSQGMYYIAFGVAFFYGSKLVKRDDLDYDDLFRIFGCIVLGSVQLGRTMVLSSDGSQSLKAAKRIFALHDKVPPIDAYSAAGKSPAQETCHPTVHFNNIDFRYPARPDVKILDVVSVSAESGQTLALVGESGCGKSTMLQLLERFYDPDCGQVSIDRFDIKDLNVKWLRQQMSLVSQEPILFDTSVAENIAYGDNSREVLMEEIIQAAKAANIHQFITALPEGYATIVGSKGSMLSGGQKQRVAIARALIKNPRILLLDEATSALDSESEKVVQEALERARDGRTCITIAHRLSTIQHADKIAVFKSGQICEVGTHAELIAQRGVYYSLHSCGTILS